MAFTGNSKRPGQDNAPSKLTMPPQDDRLTFYSPQLLHQTMTIRSLSTKTIFAALVLSMPLLAHADASQDATIKQLIEVGHMDNIRAGLAQQATDSAIPLLREYLAQNKIAPTPAQQQKLQANLKGYVDQQHKLASNYFNTAATKNKFQSSLIKAYSTQFTPDELKQILAFYQSAAGKKLMEVQPQIVNGVASDMLKTAETGLLPQMRSAAANYAKSMTK